MDRNRVFFLGITALGAGVILLSRKAELKSDTTKPTIYYGVYTGTDSGIPTPGVELEQFEIDSGKKVSILGNVTWWYDTFTWGDFNTLFLEWVNNIRNHGSIPLIMWQPFNPLRADGSVISRTDLDYFTQIKKYSLKNIVNGNFDTYIHTWAKQIKLWKHPIMLRPMHELNVSQNIDAAHVQSWAASLRDVDGTVINEPQDAVNAWQHIVDIFREEGANNVTWVWSVLSWPSVLYGGTNSISLSSIYPGDNYVDWVGIECYNQNFLPQPEACNSTDIQGIYQEVLSLSIKPVMMAEMGAKENIYNSNAKPEWIKNALSFDRVQSIPYIYPKIKAVFYWNDGRDDLRLWIESSSQSINAFKEVIANQNYTTNNYSTINISPIPPPSITHT